MNSVPVLWAARTHSGVCPHAVQQPIPPSLPILSPLSPTPGRKALTVYALQVVPYELLSPSSLHRKPWDEATVGRQYVTYTVLTWYDKKCLN